MTRQPVAPMGCPRPIPEPLTLVISLFNPSSRSQPMYWAAKASLTSTSSKSFTVKPLRTWRWWTAGTGESPITAGWQAPRPGVKVGRERGTTIMTVTDCVEMGIEEAAAAVDVPLIFQLYVRSDRKWIEDILDQAKAAGYRALCVTVDRAY